MKLEVAEMQVQMIHRAGDDREKENKVTLNAEWRGSSRRRTWRIRSRTSYVEGFNSNQLPSPKIARKRISRSK